MIVTCNGPCDTWTNKDVTVAIEYSEETMPEGYMIQYRIKDVDINTFETVGVTTDKLIEGKVLGARGYVLAYTYEEIMKYANTVYNEMTLSYNTCNLPETVDRNKVNELLIQARKLV